MKSRPTQFGAREHTASPRQHASRLAVDHSQLQSNGAPRDDRSFAHATDAISLYEEPILEAANFATDGDRPQKDHLLSVHDVAELLQVPASWVYGRTRDRCADRIPGFRLGKYWRFAEADVLAWIRSRQLRMRRNPCVPEYNGTR